MSPFIRNLDRALEREPADPTIRYLKGLALLELGHTELAADELRRVAQSASPKASRAKWLLARMGS